MKIVSLSDAVKVVKSGDTVGVGHAMAEPKALIDALTKRHQELRDVTITHMITTRKTEYVDMKYKGSFIHNSLFVGASVRGAVEDGRADFTPCHFSQIPALFHEKIINLDIAFIQVTPPDRYGYVSLGVSVDYTMSLVKNAAVVVAQINPSMPRTLGDSFIHVSEIDYGVEREEELLEIPKPELSQEEISIGRHCAGLIHDGATLQLGIGSIPDAVLSMLKNKKDLGIHSEMISDGVMNLVERGVITNKKKTLHKDKIVATFIMGTKKLYDFIDNNPMLYMAPADYVNSPYIIGKNENLISINSCVQVDLTGQICAESVGRRQISASGGQVDFIRGANLSRGGFSIIALPSGAKNGTLSKIVDTLDEGAVVTTSRNDVRYIVTENGVADLKGKSIKERGRSLIEIAHENFRVELIRKWEIRFHDRF